MSANEPGWEHHHTIFYGEPSSYSEGEMSDLKLGGYTGPGWYFVDETEAYWYGPHKTEEEAAGKCVEYAKAMRL